MWPGGELRICGLVSRSRGRARVRGMWADLGAGAGHRQQGLE